eukprot:TRINITY_DN34268_c0_g1_i1.p2 TRINITY_DN34268_c0_g1~~TRINITY_DN34268_c0_g1_i1.p2  ORF type:complete len:103 (-),score=22.91 TRINITY_DN34268_c0_g1_i1:219-527(-)
MLQNLETIDPSLAASQLFPDSSENMISAVLIVVTEKEDSKEMVHIQVHQELKKSLAKIYSASQTDLRKENSKQQKKGKKVKLVVESFSLLPLAEEEEGVTFL